MLQSCVKRTGQLYEHRDMIFLRKHDEWIQLSIYISAAKPPVGDEGTQDRSSSSNKSSKSEKGTKNGISGVPRN